MAIEGVRGRFVWYDLMTTDPAAAQEFYGALAGWGTAPFEGGGSEYTMWLNGEVPIGGVMRLPEEASAAGAPPHWLAYVGSPDVEETVQRARELGAESLVPPTDIPDVGRFAVLRDPQGAQFAVYSPAHETPVSDDMPAVGEFSWHELLTTDHEAAFRFYSELFGWRKTEAMDMGPMGVYQMYGRAAGNAGPLGGMYNRTPEMQGPPAWLFYIRVPDVDQSVATVRERGGTVLNGPMEVPGGDRVAQLVDPQGAVFAVHQAVGQQS